VFENVRGEDMFIIQPTSNPANDNLMELLIMADALRRSSAARITAVIPYFGYARQDRRTKARTPITAKLVANMMVEAGIERVLTMDLHAAQIQGFFDIPVDNLYASPIFALDILHQFKGADGRRHGGLARCGRRGPRARTGQADRRAAGHRRQAPREGRRSGRDDRDRRCDRQDLHHRRRHLRHRRHALQGRRVLMEAGATEVHAYITHGVLSGPAVERITKSVMKSLVITDTIEPTEAVKACAQHPHRAHRADVRAGDPEHLERHLGLVALRHETLEPIYEGAISVGGTRSVSAAIGRSSATIQIASAKPKPTKVTTASASPMTAAAQLAQPRHREGITPACTTTMQTRRRPTA
jgi:ribose-phosphate pyrophosphokinase